MAKLSPSEREQVYLEEKKNREASASRAVSSRLLLFLTLGVIAGVAGYLTLRERRKKKSISIEDLRKAYDGLAPEDENV